MVVFVFQHPAFDWTAHCCSISGTAYSFEQTCRDGCACSGCSTEGFFEYEGYRLRVYGPSCPCSGSPEDPKGGDDEDDEPPSRGVSAYFTKSVIFLEDEYESAPGETVPWQSTETKLVCSAAGGPFGGRVKIEIEGADNLIQYTGPTLPFEQSLAAGEDLSFKIRYRAAKESGAADDIKVTATFVENETEWEQELRDSATAVRLKFEPIVAPPENDSQGRHVFGVCEEILCQQTPDAPKVAWSLSSGRMENEGDIFVCPLSATRNPLTASCGGAEYKPNIEVIEPRFVTVRDPGWDDFDAPIGEAGSIVLMMPLYIGPMNVSFAYLAVEEVPYEDHPNDGDVHTGYFARNDLALWWHHTRGNGAGTWRNVDRDTNRMGTDRVYDQAGVTETLSRVNSSGLFVDDPTCGWADGRIIMATPFGWNVRGTEGESLPYKIFAEDVYATLELQSNGTFRVEKLANEVIRHVDGSVFLNGVKMK